MAETDCKIFSELIVPKLANGTSVTVDCCALPSVKCEGNRITLMSLQNMSLAGFLPAEMGRLVGLQVLRLGNNQLTGSIPPELGELTALTELDLSGNKLQGSLPPRLGQLANLTKLAVQNNQLNISETEIKVWPNYKADFVWSPQNFITPTNTPVAKENESSGDPSMLLYGILIGLVGFLVIAISIGYLLYPKTGKMPNDKEPRIIELGENSDSVTSGSCTDSYISLREMENNALPTREQSFQDPKAFVLPESSKAAINRKNEFEEMFRGSFPDRILFFSRSNGLAKCLQLISHVLYTKEATTTAKKSQVPRDVDEIQVFIHDDILIINNGYKDGRASVYNKTRQTQGLLPVHVLNPVNKTKIMIFHEVTSTDNAADLSLLEKYENSSNGQVKYKLIHEHMNNFHVKEMFATATSDESVECFIKGDKAFAAEISAILGGVVSLPD